MSSEITVDPGAPLGSSEGREFTELLGLFDAPAYVRRARAMEASTEMLLADCRRQREQWLDMVQLRLGTLKALAGEWSALAAFIDQEQINELAALEGELQPKLRLPPEKTNSPRLLRRTLLDLAASVTRFNGRWAAYLKKVDFAEVNNHREGYNRYYVLEKACAMRSDVLARQGFVPIPLLDLAELTRLLPLLPEIRVREQ